MYWVMLHRWEEMLAFAKTSGTAWPIEKDMEAAFDSFAIGVNLTQRCYDDPINTYPNFNLYGQIHVREGGAALDLAALRTSLGMGPCANGTKRVEPTPSPCHKIACPAGWTRNGTDIRNPCNTPAPRQCAAGTALAHT